MVSGHSFESFVFDKFPEVEISPMDNLRVLGGILYFFQQFFSFNLLHRVPLSCSNVDGMIFFC